MNWINCANGLVCPQQPRLPSLEFRISGPVRRVRSAAGNMSVRYPSRKMGFTIQVGSHKNELAGVYEMEHDRQILEYYDQPCQFPLEYLAKSGRRVRVLHTPGFFVIRPDAVGWEEWKTEEELQQLGDKMPHRYLREANGCGYVGLVPHWRQRGNRTQKLPEATLILLAEFIKQRYETFKQKSKRQVYSELVRQCEAEQLVAPSYPTFVKAVNHRPRHQQIEKPQGTRAAYPYEPFYFELSLTTPRHGDRPFEIGHIDHTELDIELVCARTGRNLGRPWVTFLVDAFSRRLAAIHLSFDPPSYRACMMILRECVRRHGRLPQIIEVDGGREFASVYFETLLARYECTKKVRPGAKPRFGSVCERLFGTANTTFVHQLLGSTLPTRQVRQLTKAVDPKEHACWDLAHLHQRLCEWAYEVYDTLEHPALGQTPRAAFVAGLAQSGQRSHRLIAYDEAFQMFTMPTTPKGTARVQPNLGVKINGIYYWADAFRDREIERTRIPVRYDPFDVGIAYALVKNRWVSCISECYADLQGRTEREVMLASQELRQQQQQHGQQFTVTAKKLAEFLTSVEAEEVLLQQRLRDAAGQAVLRLTSEPVSGQSDVNFTPARKATVPENEAAVEPVTPVSDEWLNKTGEILTIYGDF